MSTGTQAPSIKVIEVGSGPTCLTCSADSDLVSIRGADPVYACHTHGHVANRPDRADLAAAYLAIAGSAAEVSATVTVIAKWEDETYTEDTGTVAQVSSRTVFLRNGAGTWVRPADRIVEIRVAHRSA